MPQPPLPPATERFAATLFALGWAVAQQTGWGLSLRLIALITTRINRIKHRFAALAARIAAGTYKPRPPSKAAPRQPEKNANRKPPPANPLPNTPGWLLPLEKSAICHRTQIEVLFQDAEMVALMAAAPEAMAKVLRPLCRMLRLDLPPVLVKPRAAARRPARKRSAPPAAPRDPPRAPPPLPRPAPAPGPLSLALEFVGGRPRLVWT